MRISDWSSDVCSSDLSLADQRHLNGACARRHIFSADAQQQRKDDRQRRQKMAEPIGQAKGINLVPAIKDVIGEARSAQEHTQHRPAARSSIRQRYKFPRHDMLIKAGLGNVDKSEERRVGKDWASTFRSRWSR